MGRPKGSKNKESRPIINMVGQRYIRLVVIAFSHFDQHSNSYWLVHCDCGNENIVQRSNLLTGNAQSCGCLGREVHSKLRLIHGMSHTSEHRAWCSMIERCLDTNNPRYKDYGGRGITICKKWLEPMGIGFINFYKDVGPKPSKKHSLDRKDNNGNYESENVKWSTPKQQAQNTRMFTQTKNRTEHKRQRSRLMGFLNKLAKGKSVFQQFEENFGISLQGFKQYIESLFLPDMTWQNHGKGSGKWQFDHIIGCNNFDLSKEEDRKTCFYYKNFQPLWWKDHKHKNKNLLKTKTTKEN